MEKKERGKNKHLCTKDNIGLLSDHQKKKKKKKKNKKK